MVKDRIEDKAVLERIFSFTPLKRLGNKADIINPVVSLASDASNFIKCLANEILRGVKYADPGAGR